MLILNMNYVLYFYISTFRSKCEVLKMAVLSSYYYYYSRYTVIQLVSCGILALPICFK